MPGDRNLWNKANFIKTIHTSYTLSSLNEQFYSIKYQKSGIEEKIIFKIEGEKFEFSNIYICIVKISVRNF